MYRIGDLVDAKDVHSAWFEGKIKQIVRNPDYFQKPSRSSALPKNVNSPPKNKVSPASKKSPKNDSNPSPSAKSSPKAGIMNYFTKLDNGDSPKSKEVPNVRSSTLKENNYQQNDKPTFSEKNGISKITEDEENRLIFRVILDG